MTDDRLESRILAFERAWHRNGVGAITAILERPPAPRGADRRRLLFELIAIDMEFRARDARSTGPRTLDAYAARFPELGTPEEWPIELIGEEYRVRRRWGDRPPHAEFLERFPERHDRVREELAKIDAELACEGADSPLSPARAPQSDASMDLPSIAHDDLRLQRMIGAGCMGKVYRAWWYGGERAVAVKFLRKTLLKEPHAVARFLAEAHTVAKLHHPKIVGIHGFGRTPAGACYLVLDLINGPNLGLTAGAPPLAVEDAVRYAIDVCDALEYAHQVGVVHCDLKPANILHDPCGTIRVADFGLARALTEHAAWTTHIEGTAPSMAPEQACRTWGPIDERTDVFGIGAVLYALLTGRPPWPGSTLSEVLSVIVSDAQVPAVEQRRPDLPSGIVEVCRKCLAKWPADRYSTVSEVRFALLAALPVVPSRNRPEKPTSSH